jgi:hypothetical protein
VQTPSGPLIASVSIIAGGTALAGYGTLNASLLGMLIQLASESAEACRLIMTQTLLQGLSFHPIEGMLYLAPASVVWMAAGAAAFEVRPMLASGDWAIVMANPGLFAAAASMGFLVTTLAFFTIQLCGSLTLKVRARDAERLRALSARVSECEGAGRRQAHVLLAHPLFINAPRTRSCSGAPQTSVAAPRLARTQVERARRCSAR